MPRTIFDESQRRQLETKIRAFLDETTHLLLLHTIEESALNSHRTQLQTYLDNDVSERLKRSIRKSLTEVNQRLSLCNDMPMQASEDLAECFIQVPSTEDLLHMKSMPAGGEEDQQQRLAHMTEMIAKHPSLPIVTTNEVHLSSDWQQLFNTIDAGNGQRATALVQAMASTDPVLRSILSIHSLAYIKSVILDCIAAQAQGIKKLNSDIIITPKTFELLIKDLTATLQHPSPLYFSFGLPSHHAYPDQGSGFCILNKTAILLNHAKTRHQTALNYLIIGTDVNRDNGLCHILRDSFSALSITHIDVFDSRVYPWHNFATINEEFSTQAQNLIPGVRRWKQDQFHYLALDLSLQARSNKTLHPAITFAVEHAEKQIKLAQSKQQQTMIFLPTGWDSHTEETAYCGKYINGQMMNKSEAHDQRFNTADLVYFQEQILQLYKTYKESIAGIYWGLEGGYERGMYQQQLNSLCRTINNHLMLEQEHTSACTLR